MKILTFTTLYPNNIWPNHGVFTKERLIPLVEKNECQFKIVAPVPYFPPVKFGKRWLFSQVVKKEERDGVEVYHPRYFITPKVGMSTYGLLMFLSVLPIVKKIQKEFDFDIIDAQFVYPDGFAGVLLGHYFKRPIVITSHGTDINLYPKFPVIRQLLKYALNSADKVIAVCQALKTVMVQLGIPEEKMVVIPNGIDLSKFYPISKEEARKKLSIPNRKLIISVGALIPRKGFDLLINALKILHDDFLEKDIQLVIVGEGPSRGALEKLISSLSLGEHVRLVGSIPHHELNVWLSAADLFCLASSREGWACVLLESMACGTPIVATDVWGAPEVIQSDRVGLLTKLNARDIAQKISLALKKTWKSEEIVKYAREYTWERAAFSAYGVFKSALNGFSPKKAIYCESVTNPTCKGKK